MGHVIDQVTSVMDETDWSALRCADGTADKIPERMLDLLRATVDEDADRAYWRIDNHVIVQGRYYDAAPPLIAPIGLALAGEGIAAPARRALAELLTELALGHPHEDESDPDVLRVQVQAGFGRLKDVLHRLQSDVDDRVREDARLILEAIQP